MAASQAICSIVGGHKRAWANFIAAAITSLFLVTMQPMRAPHMLYLLETESIMITFCSIPFRFITEKCLSLSSYMNSRYTSSAIKNKSCFLTNSPNCLISDSEYKYPVGLFGLQIRMAFDFGVMAFSNSSMVGSVNPLSILEITGTTLALDSSEKAW